MIDFACKKFDLNEIVRCSLNLTKTEFKIMEYLIKNNEEVFTTIELARTLKVGLSTAQKAVKKLKQNSVVEQKQKNLETGGYLFTYTIKDKPLLRKIILGIVHNWMQKVETGIKKW